MDVHSCEVNWAPLSDDRSIGTPKRVIQWDMSAWVQVALVKSLRGMASVQPEKRSTIMNK